MYTVPAGKKFEGLIGAYPNGFSMRFTPSGGVATEIPLPSIIQGMPSMPITLTAGTIAAAAANGGPVILIGVETDA